MKKVSIAIVTAIFVCWSVAGQDSTNQSKEIESIDNFFNNIKKGENSKLMPPVLPLNMPAMEINEQTREEFNRSMQEFYAYRTSGYQHRRHVFEWQLFSSKIIFYVVIFLVTIGLFFSGVQFYAAYKKNFTDPKVTELSASSTGIKVSSSVLGVIILIISLIFFYLYLVYVYPISEIL
ncbi:MAG: hypothetical protein HQ522_13975 [Bacteroidetes bacterium]|nr:hypothetical protein [Bacteroidota bacterium]